MSYTKEDLEGDEQRCGSCLYFIVPPEELSLTHGACEVHGGIVRYTKCNSPGCNFWNNYDEEEE